MAQRTEKEETELKVVPETLTLCVNNCGVTGNPATNNMCQKCFNATRSSTASSSASASSVSVVTAASATSIKIPRSSLARSSSMERSSDLAQPSTDRLVTATAAVDVKSAEAEAAVTMKRGLNRCSGCPRKVGLTGFRCRCGDLFCWEHRYSDRHDCSYDYKAVGRDAIARENPVIKAAKIVRL